MIREFLTEKIRRFELLYSHNNYPSDNLEKMFAVERLVLSKGVLKFGRRLPIEYEFGEEKMCFMNATNLVLNNPKLRYVEGYASRASVPIMEFQHGWAIDENGDVVDNTWRKGVPEDEYLGVVIPTALLRQTLVKNGYYGVLTNQYGQPSLGLIEKLKALEVA